MALWFAAAGPDWFPRADFTAFYAGWAIVRDGRAASLYDLAVQATYQAGGKQYVIIAAGGGKGFTKPGDQFVAFALPSQAG